MSYYPEFSKLINDKLARMDRPSAWLARRLDVNPSTVNRWLNHGSRPGDPEIVVRIADILGMSDQRHELLIAAGYGYQEGQQETEPLGNGAGSAAESRVPRAERPSETLARIPTNLPVQATALVGREEELEALIELCEDPAVRLITIMGPGGMGKTRLALAVAEQQYETGNYPDGVFYVSLDATARRHNMVTAIADSLGLSAAGRDMEKTVLNQLQSMKAMVLLDNFDLLIPEADFVAALVASAPHVKVLVTTRARLNLQEEWAIDLHGLSYPKADTAVMPVVAEPREYEAVDMFLQRIEQINSGYEPTEEDIELAVEICQLVQGMPLALELAAGWTRYMMLDEIIHEIESNIDFFATTVVNVPERHRSLRAVFRQSWQMLTDEEQQAYAALSVFRGGFSRQAAAQVAGVSLPVIASLVDKSLVSRVKSGHYEVHGMLRLFAAEYLAEDTGVQAEARAAHARFYCEYLAERTEDLHTRRQLEALKKISAEVENIRAAWYTAIEMRAFELLALAVEGWFLLAELGGYIQQGYDGLHQALLVVDTEEDSVDGRVDDTTGGRRSTGAGDKKSDEEGCNCRRLLLAKLLARHAMIRTRYGGSHPTIIGELERSLALLSDIDESDHMDTSDELAYTHNALALMRYFSGDEEGAEMHIQQALQIAQASGNAYEIGNAWSNRALLDEFQGRFTDAAAMFSRSIEFYSEAGESNRKAYSLNNWGRAAYGMGDYELAESLVRQALAIREDFNDLVGISYSMLDLGQIADCRGDYLAAEQVMQEGLSVARTIENDETIMRFYLGLADVARHTGNLIRAESYLNRARDISQELVIPSHKPIYLAGLGKVAYQRIGPEAARSLYEESLALCIEMGNVGEEAEVRFSLAKLDLEQSRPHISAQNLIQCIDIATDTGAQPLALAAIVLGARFDPQIMPGDFDAAVYLSFAVDHPAAWYHTRVLAAQLLGYENGVPATRAATAVEAEPVRQSVETIARSIANALAPLAAQGAEQGV